MNTESDLVAYRPGDHRDPAVDVLFVALLGGDPALSPSRHVLTDVDVVEFGRGDRSVCRDCRDGLRRLVIHIPDPLLSRQHGQLTHAYGTWQLDVGQAKNAAAIDGVRTRAGRLSRGQLLALGNTILFIAREPASEALDLDATALSAPQPELATFHRDLAASIDRMARLAGSAIPMLVLGETGTGKEVAARAIHALSGRLGSFVAVNCAAIAPTLLEAELFGHRRAAFSGATTERLGHLRTSDHGTLFLDEIAELALPAQAALLRALQEREVVPVGATLPVPVDLRVVAATHRDLEAMVNQGRFREDLYARLAGFTLHLPPLRARRTDLGLLIAALLRRQSSAARAKITWPAGTQLFRYTWPRNIRELERALEIAVPLAGAGPITVDCLPEAVRGAPVPQVAPTSQLDPEAAAGNQLALVDQSAAGPTNAPDAVALPAAASVSARARDDMGDVQRADRDRVLRALHDCAWNQTRAAKQLGISRTTLVTKLGLYRIPRPRN